MTFRHARHRGQVPTAQTGLALDRGVRNLAGRLAQPARATGDQGDLALDNLVEDVRRGTAAQSRNRRTRALCSCSSYGFPCRPIGFMPIESAAELVDVEGAAYADIDNAVATRPRYARQDEAVVLLVGAERKRSAV